MGTVIHTSDGGTVRLSSDTHGIMASLASALERKVSLQSPRGTTIPPGYVEFHTVDGESVFVNAAEIARVEAA